MTGKGGKLTAISLTQLSTSITSLNQTSIYRGTITNLRKYDSRTKVLCFRLAGIGEDKGTIEVEVREEVGDEMNRKLKEGKQIILKGKGGKLVLPRNDRERSKVVYEKMINGYFLPGEVSFEISQGASALLRLSRECANLEFQGRKPQEGEESERGRRRLRQDRFECEINPLCSYNDGDREHEGREC